MTAEIGVLNRNGVALAADSAVTISNNGKVKVLNTANKLFNLSAYEPVGIMIYGDGDYMNTPWEIIIKEYRKNLKNKKFNTLKEYCDDFFDFLFSYEGINNKYKQQTLVASIFINTLDDILNQVNQELYDLYPAGVRPPEEVVKSALAQKIKGRIAALNDIDTLNTIDDFSLSRFSEEYHDIINDISSQKINMEIEYSVREDLINLAYLAIIKDSFYNYTGVVIAGYGDDEIFPSIYEYYVSGVISNYKKYKLNTSNIISDTNNASVNPFAQQEMVHSVITGIEPSMYNMIMEALDSVTLGIKEINKQIIENNELDIDIEKYSDVFNNAGIILNNEVKQYIENIKRDYYIRPILNMVGMLPKDELAAMAETLVNLTSFKRRITIDQETVGGPIDVAIISKTEGFIWIKRKHYFDPNLNYNYFNKVKGEYEDVSNKFEYQYR